MTGRLFGVGVGPGDPELMTAKAQRVIAASSVVAHFAAKARPGNAWAVIAARAASGRLPRRAAS